MAAKKTKWKLKGNDYGSVIRSELDRIEYEQGLVSNVGEALTRFSSGCLVNDLIIGGGIPPAMVTYSGHEGGGKTTLLNHTLNGGITAKLRNFIHFDAENSRDPEYVINIYRNHSFEQIYGIPGKEPGEWAQVPLINYYPYSQFERVFATFRGLLNIMPDKVYRKQDKTWYYVFRNKKEEVTRMKLMELKPDKKLSDRKRYWCPTDDVGLQAIIAVDSWVALVMEDQEEDEENKQGIAAESREFPKQLRRVCGRLLRKQVAMIGCNQIRVNPMAGPYGNPEYEPGGSALKFWSDIRNGLRPVVPKDGFIRDKDARALGVEPSVFGKGKDHYAFKNLTNIKNKYGRPLLRGQFRIWVSDEYGQAHGIDPVYDIFQFLKMTGQVAGSPKKGLTLDFPELKGKFKWLEFKELVLSQHFGDRKSEKALLKKHKAKKRLDLRKLCEKQLKTGKATELFQAEQASGKPVEDDASDYEESSG